MPGVKQVTDTQTDWQQGTLSGVVATAAGDLELRYTGDYRYRIPITVTNNEAVEKTDVPVLVTFDTASLIASGKMRADGGDIRFAPQDSFNSADWTTYSYWLWDGLNTAATRIYVKVPLIPASGSVSFYLYFGNSEATSQSNGAQVFTYFDGVEDGDVSNFRTNEISVSADSTEVYTGSFSVRHDAEGPSWDDLVNYLDGVVHDWRGHLLEFEYKGWASDGVYPFDYSVDPINSAGHRMNSWRSIGIRDFWQTFSGDLDTNTYAADILRIQHFTTNDNINRKIWMDNIRVRKKASVSVVLGQIQQIPDFGTRTSPPIDLSPVVTAAGSSISWAATTPAGTSVTVETRLSLDGGQTWGPWQACSNGGSVPGIAPGTDLSNAQLQTRQTLATTDTTVTPQLHSLTVAVPVAGSASAPVLVQIGVSRSVAPPVPVSVGLAEAVSGPVLVQAGLAKATARELRVYVVAVSRRVPASRRIRARLNIGRPDGATWQDVTDYLASARISLGDVRSLGTGNEGVDERVRMATFVLRQDRVPGGPSLSPRDRTSPWNQWAGQYAPLIWPRRQVLFEAKVVADSPSHYLTQVWAEPVGFGDGTTRAFQLDRWPVEPGSEVVYVNGVAQQRGTAYTIDYATGQVTFATAPPAGLPITADYTYWLPVLEGLIDDWRTDGPTVEFNCRDMAAVLQDTYIEMTRTYGSGEGTPLEQVIQQILDDNLGAGAVQLYCPRSPGFAVRPYNVEYQSVWDAVQSAVSKTIGWYLGYWLDPTTNRFRLTLLEPPRNKTAADADWELDYRDDIYVDDLGGSIADVRNAVRVTFRNAATGKRETITVEDSASIAEYGRRAMQIEEADASLIDTPEEATALAVAAVSDLKDQHATANLELPFLPMLNVMDGVVVRDDRVSSEPDFYAVESVEHTLDFDGGRFRTTAVCSGRVVGAHTRWMEMQTRPGAQQPTRMVSADATEVTQAVPPQPVGIFMNGTLAGVEVYVPEPVMRNWRITRVRLKDGPGGNILQTAEGRSTRFVFPNTIPGVTYWADAQYENTSLQAGPWSDEVNSKASGVTQGYVEERFNTHAASGDHDGRYYRKNEWARSAGGAGYVKLPNGMILQWGLSPSVGHDGHTSATFPIAFPTDCLRVIAVKQNSTTSNDDNWAVVRGFSKTQANFRMEGMAGAQSGTRYVAYLAIGY